MCFIKSKSSPKIPKRTEDPVVRHQADASVTKSSLEGSNIGYKDNIKTSAVGLTDDAATIRKTLLGE